MRKVSTGGGQPRWWSRQGPQPQPQPRIVEKFIETPVFAELEICSVPKTVTPHTFCTLSTLTGETITLDAEKSDTVVNIKSKIQVKEGTPLDQEQLTPGGKQVEDKSMISEYNITLESTLYASRRLLALARVD